jgi:NAD+ synthase
LPPADALDALLDRLTGEKPSAGADGVPLLGQDADMVNRVWRLMQAAEATRRQSPPGPRITRRTTGHDPRFPIRNGVTTIAERAR